MILSSYRSKVVTCVCFIWCHIEVHETDRICVKSSTLLVKFCTLQYYIEHVMCHKVLLGFRRHNRRQEVEIIKRLDMLSDFKTTSGYMDVIYFIVLAIVNLSKKIWSVYSFTRSKIRQGLTMVFCWPGELPKFEAGWLIFHVLIDLYQLICQLICETPLSAQQLSDNC